MNYYERHIGDYLKDTSHLSLLEHGVYSRLMDVYYTREGGIPQTDAARLIGARSNAERAALSAVLGEFFALVDGAHVQDRCEREIARFVDKQAKARRSAEARWGASKTHSEGNATASPDAMRTHSEGNAHHTPDTSNQTPDPIHTHAAPATQAGRVCLAMKAEGIGNPNPGHPDLLMLLDAGATEAEFAGAAQAAVHKGKGFAYAIGTIKRQRQEAASSAKTLHRGPMPQPAETTYQRSQRERMAKFAPGVAAKDPGSQPAANVIDMEPANGTPIALG